jgi:hypothetical protein
MTLHSVLPVVSKRMIPQMTTDYLLALANNYRMYQSDLGYISGNGSDRLR